MTAGDGDGWVTCALGHRHWGRHGAAGLLLRDETRIVLQHRAPWSHQGDTWGLPGGAIDSHEDAVAGALREAAEEAAIDPTHVLVVGTHTVEHGGWSYTTVLAEPIRPVSPLNAGPESVSVGWQPVTAMAELLLHPGFGAAWPTLATFWPVPTVVVDVANVMGSRPDGWWRDRAGAAGRLLAEVLARAAAGLDGRDLPGANPERCHPRLVAILEGAARAAAPPDDPRLVVRRAPGSGDDEIVAAAAELAAATPGRVLVVTADRGLRARVAAAGAAVAGPRRLLP